MRNVVAFSMILLWAFPWCLAGEWPLPPTPPLVPDIQLGKSDTPVRPVKPAPSTAGKPLTMLILQDGTELLGRIVSEKDLTVVLIQEDGNGIPVHVDDIDVRAIVPATVQRPDEWFRFRPGALRAEMLLRPFLYPSRGRRKRLAFAEGGDRETEKAVDAALAWLARHQETDGHWDAERHDAEQKTDTACTGLALMAFLSAGHTEEVGGYSENVRRAVKWLISRQKASGTDGLVFDPTDAGAHRGVGYPHAIAGTALVEAAGASRIPETMEAAQRAVDYSIGTHQDQEEGNPRGGFRYSAKSTGDLSVTGWYLMQLKSAQRANLKVDPKSLEAIALFIDRCRSGRETPSYGYQPGNPHDHSVHRLTAVGNLCRQFLGTKKEDLQASVTWFVENGGLPGGWGEGKTDLYYWYYGTLCTFQQGGEVWQKWNDAMKKTLCGSQQHETDASGSWDPVGEYSKEWGRVGQTALCCLCLEVYYRYPRVQKGSQGTGPR